LSGDAPPLAPAAGTCAIGTCGLVWVEGPDASSFLHGLVTCSVTDIPVGAGRLGLLLDAKGHIGVQLQIVRDAETGFTLITDADSAAALVDDLERFHFSEDLEILGPESSPQLIVAAPVPPAGVAVAAPGWIPGTWTVVTDDPAALAARLGCTPVGTDALERARIRAGVARVGTDTATTTLVQEVGFEDRAVDFAKGCYLGQEIVERIRSRGGVHRHLRPLGLSGPVPPGGTELTLEGGAAAGQITSAAELPLADGRRVFALGMMRAEAEARGQQFRYKVGALEGTAGILAAPPSLGKARA
jgi:folate-binding protein YgfZ